MSSMLEQAIVDAKSLREAAIRNAEETLVEKYSDDIKEAVEKLLEQDDEDALGLEEQEEDTPDVPLAATDGEDLCPCPDEEEQGDVTLPAADLAAHLNEELEFDLQKIKEELDELEESEIGTPEPHEDVAEELAEDVDIFDDELEEQIELSEEELSDLLEKVIVDMAPVGASWAGRPAAERDFEVEKHLAVLAQETDDEELEELKKENKKLEGKLAKLQESVKSLKSREDKYKEVVTSLKEKFDEMALSNARLVYTNKVLNSDSLNERQKRKVVDAISNVNSAEEAKVIFEALQTAVGTAPVKRRGPKSLSEMVEKRNSSLLAARRKKQSDVPNSAKSRMQRLAGIK